MIPQQPPTPTVDEEKIILLYDKDGKPLARPVGFQRSPK